MTFYDAHIRLKINAENPLDAADILELTLNDLHGVRDVIISIDNKNGSLSTSKVKIK
jgi:hypothetical protein